MPFLLLVKSHALFPNSEKYVVEIRLSLQQYHLELSFGVLESKFYTAFIPLGDLESEHRQFWLKGSMVEIVLRSLPPRLYRLWRNGASLFPIQVRGFRDVSGWAAATLQHSSQALCGRNIGRGCGKTGSLPTAFKVLLAPQNRKVPWIKKFRDPVVRMWYVIFGTCGSYKP